jgi:hypothetical protein
MGRTMLTYALGEDTGRDVVELILAKDIDITARNDVIFFFCMILAIL